MAVDTTTFLADFKTVYGAIQNQVSRLAAFMNLLGDGTKFGKPENRIGARGYTFLAALGPNWNMGYRKEGTGGVGNAGNQNLVQSSVFLKYAYVPIVVTGQAENLSRGDERAFMQAKALEAKFDMKDIVSHANVVMVGAERGGQLAQTTAAAAGTLTCSTAGNLPGALYLRVGMLIDCGPVGGGANSVTGATITAIDYATGVVTHNGGAANVGDAVYLSGEAPQVVGDFPITAEGLISLVSDAGAVQGIDPGVAGQQGWESYLQDAGAVQISPQLILQLKQFVRNRGGSEVDLFYFPSAQVNQLVGIATTTLRFDVGAGKSVGKRALDLGFDTYEFAGTAIVEDKDARQDRIYALASDMWKKFEAVPLSMAEDEAGVWTRMSGANGVADATQGLLRWYHQLGTLQRSAAGVLKNLTVPANFSSAAPTL